MSLSSENRIYKAIDEAFKKSGAGQYQEAINTFKRILTSLRNGQNPGLSARVELELGECYYGLSNNGAAEENIENAIQFYTEALTYYTVETDPYAFIMISEKLGRIHKYLFRKNQDQEQLQSAITYYTQAINVFRNSCSLFTTLNNYRTADVSELKKEEYIYLHASTQYNLTSLLIEKVQSGKQVDDYEYLESLKTAIELLNNVVDAYDLQPSDYLNAWYTLGISYNLLSEKTDEKMNLDCAVNAFENGLKYYFSKKRFKEMYPKYFDLVVKQIEVVKQKTGETVDVDEYKSYENARQEIEEDVCSSCGDPNPLKGYTIPLCERCRREYVRFKTPLWTRIFIALILAAAVFAVIKLPEVLGAGIDFERGMRADNELKCQTALKYLTRAQSKYPDSLLINSKIFIDLAKCGKYSEASIIYNDKLANKKTDDDRLYREINEMCDRVFMPNDNYSELIQIVNSLSQDTRETTIKKLENYNQKYPRNVEGLVYLGNIYFEMGKFEKAKELEQKALLNQPDRDDIRLSLAATYRQTGELDNSMKECEYILKNINSENTIAIGSISRLYLKKHQFGKALEYAKKAVKIDGEEEYNIETIALAYHFNHMIKERDATVEKLKSMNYNATVKKSDLEFLQEVFDGKSKLYN